MDRKLKVLFVCSGNSDYFEIAPFIKAQGDSLKAYGVDVDYFTVKGKGIRGYLKNVPQLRKGIKANKYDVIHAHYSLNAALTLLTFTRVPIVASYMGSDVYGSFKSNGKIKPSSYWIIALSLLIQPFLKYVICKSQTINRYVYKKRTSIIPNGVNIDKFKPTERGKHSEMHKILFLGNKKSTRKNYTLLEGSMFVLADESINIIAPFPVNHTDLPHYYNIADVFALCSLEEGSPNVIKEAMACNCPIVSTDVGDVKWLLGDLEGHYIADKTPEDFAEKIKLALDFRRRTKGRERLMELGLDSESVAAKLFDVYQKVLSSEF